VATYEGRFVSLCNFTDNMFQTEERKAYMFARGLRPQIRRYLVSQSFCTLREVADAAIKQEIEILATEDKGKDKTFCGRRTTGSSAEGTSRTTILRQLLQLRQEGTQG